MEVLYLHLQTASSVLYAFPFPEETCTLLPAFPLLPSSLADQEIGAESTGNTEVLGKGCKGPPRDTWSVSQPCLQDTCKQGSSEPPENTYRSV